MTLEEARASLEAGRSRARARRAAARDRGRSERLLGAGRPRLPRARSGEHGRRGRALPPGARARAGEHRRAAGDLDHPRRDRDARRTRFDAASAVAEAPARRSARRCSSSPSSRSTWAGWTRPPPPSSACGRSTTTRRTRCTPFHGLIEVELRRERLAPRARPGRRRHARRPRRAHDRHPRLRGRAGLRPGRAARRPSARRSSPRSRAPATSTADCTWRPGDGSGGRPREPGTDVQWTRCPSCDAFVYYKRLQRNLGVCPECNYHFRLPVATRLEQLLDEGSFEDLSGDLEPLDALGFADSKPYVAADRGGAAQDRLPRGARRTGRRRSAASRSWSP